MGQYAVEGEQIIGNLYKLLMAVKLHGETNKTVVTVSDTLIVLLSRFFKRETFLSIKINDNRFYFQDEKLIYRRETETLFNKACQFFSDRSIAEIRILSPNEPMTSAVIHKIAFFLYHSIKAAHPVVWIKKRLLSEGITWIDVDLLPEKQTLDLFREQSAPPQKVNSRPEKGQKTYASAMASIKGVAEKVSGPNYAGIRKTQRMIQKMVDLIIEDESILMGMSTIRDYDDYTYCHSVNVSILAMCFGLNIGLSRQSVEILGICGLFHDLGKVDIPSEIIRKPGKLTREESRIIEKHSLYSVTKILKLNAPRELKSRILRSPFEHHIKFNLTGYPRLNQKKPVSLFGRILAIADVFDAITSPRAYRPVAFSPDEALGKMLEGSGTDFDPLLLKAFINMIGIYPVGTLLQLDTGELGLVSGKGKSSMGNRPDVVVLETDKETGYKKGPMVSLEERDSKTMAYIRNIVGSFHPGQFGIQPAQYLL
ncbi:MAG: HD domain-containing protein [Proteobacteria bacterium]|nr:HD domain-containing protein [Pseudomonadota bacterium]